MKDGFWKYIESRMTMADYTNLTRILRCSPHRLTKLQNGSQDFTIAEIEALAETISEDPVGLSQHWRLGYSKNTVTQMQDFALRYGQQFSVNVQAA